MISLKAPSMRAGSDDRPRRAAARHAALSGLAPFASRGLRAPDQIKGGVRPFRKQEASLIYRELEMLHPVMRPNARLLMEDLAGRPWQDGEGRLWLFRVFETYRSPARQDRLHEGGSVTKARRWQSAHQYGLAMDVVPHSPDPGENGKALGWSWEEFHPWDLLRDRAEAFGLYRPIDWDKAHIEDPNFQEIRHAF